MYLQIVNLHQINFLWSLIGTFHPCFGSAITELSAVTNKILNSYTTYSRANCVLLFSKISSYLLTLKAMKIKTTTSLKLTASLLMTLNKFFFAVCRLVKTTRFLFSQKSETLVKKFQVNFLECCVSAVS